MTELRKKSVHDLRIIAQSFGVPDIFEKDAVQLAQAIELKQQAMAPVMPPPPERPVYDARLMTKPPSRTSSPLEITELLTPYIQRGLTLSMDEERWYMAWGKRTDEGTLRMPLRHVLDCADRIMRGK